MYEREFVCVRERTKRELLECFGVDNVREKKRKKESEGRDNGEDKQVGFVKENRSRHMCLQV